MAGPCGPEAAAQSSAPPAGSEAAAAGAAPPPAGPTGAATLSARSARPRMALAEFALEGDGQSPGMAMQLRDGFLIGLVREGIDVIDSTDVAKQLAGSPELKGCETSPCLKRLGEMLSVRYVLRVKISLSGNSYRMSARMFSTEGAAPAALPVAVLFRPCDVCTVNEAREHMIRLAEGIRSGLDEQNAPAPTPPPPPPPPPRSQTPAFVTIAAGLAAIVGGALLIASSPEVGRRRPAIGGAVVGLGLAASLIGARATFELRSASAAPRRPPEP